MSLIRRPDFVLVLVLVLVHVLVLAPRPALAYGDPAPAPAPAPAPPPEPKEERADRPGFIAELQAGIAYRRLFDVPVVAADVGVALGGQFTGGAAFALFDGVWGSTDEGLLARQFHFGGGYEAIFDSLRIGADLHIAYFAVARRTPGQDISSIGIGAAFRLTYDLVRSEGDAFFLGVRLPVDAYFGEPPPIVWGASAVAGFRF